MEQQIAAVLFTSVVVLATYIYWIRRNKSHKKSSVMSRVMKPEELEKVQWESVGKISKVWIYPVKSCAAVTLQSAQTKPLGLTSGEMRDRSFAFTTEKGNLIRGSMIGATVLIKPVLNGDTLILKHSDVEDLCVDLKKVEEEGKESTINILGTIAPGFDCGDTAAKWLEKVFKKKARLLYHSNIPSPRNSKELVGKHSLVKADDKCLYSDDSPYMMMTRESIANLQSRLESPIYAENFRPNLLVEGSPKAYDEDDWGYVKIGDAIFRHIGPCGRCMFTTVNYETGIKNKDTEPLRTLKKYRCEGEDPSPYFGIFLAVEVEGTVSEGDEVYVTRLSQM